MLNRDIFYIVSKKTHIIAVRRLRLVFGHFGSFLKVWREYKQIKKSNQTEIGIEPIVYPFDFLVH